MNAENVAVFIVAFHPDSYYNVADSEDNMSAQDLLSLTEILIQNNYDICIESSIHNIFILCDKSLENIVVNSESHQLVFTEPEDLHRFIADKKAKYAKMIIINANTVGLTKHKIDQMLNLLDMEDEVTLLGIDHFDKIGFTASCSYGDELLTCQIDNCNFHDLFKQVPHLEYYFILMSGIYSVTNLADFKHLYSILSQRENFNMCSKDIYDRFTELFIEYKELIS
jgi:hypothetical protein